MGIEMCGCKPGYIRQMNSQGNEICTGIAIYMQIFSDNITNFVICMHVYDHLFVFIDVNECDSFDCGNGTCINMPGSYTCICPSGYIFNFDDLQCIGILIKCTHET